MAGLAQLGQLLKTLVDGVVAVIKFIPKLLHDLIMVISLVTESASRLPAIFQIFPGVLSSILISVLGVVVLYKIMGREG